ncbi:MAG: triphosphoribosyl-dephospho-CoA synthase [Methanophagales archaeon ANME-1-THS]|nr:MAG: triphosphoribosyl-dephospho-CoA synthase [Methanophagales archaeon ANME-1-THS]
MDEDDVARSAQLALLLEVSAYPKPGNVDRTHDFRDTCYEHFLASSVAVYPILREAAARGSRSERGVGELIRRGVEESVAWQSGGNTHFGALLLLVPLAMAAGACERSNAAEIKRKATEIMQNTSVGDAVEVYTAFPKAKVKVRREVPELDVMDEASIPEIRAKKLSLYAILTISASYDQISRELVGGFEKTFEYAALITDFAKGERINDTITHAYLRLLASEEDTFITMKFGPEKSSYVQQRARGIATRGYQRKELEEFDEELIREGLNPGSTADIIAAALFIRILGGLRV